MVAALPAELTPERTEGREGFLHPVEIGGDAVEATVSFIARDFEEDLKAQHIDLLRATAERVVGAHPPATVEVTDEPQYPNMRDHLTPFPEVVSNAEEAIRREGLEPVKTPIRGGTDGSQLSAKGPADAQHLHRRARVPLGPRVGLRAGDGGRRGGAGASGRGVGRRGQVGPRCNHG